MNIPWDGFFFDGALLGDIEEAFARLEKGEIEQPSSIYTEYGKLWRIPAKKDEMKTAQDVLDWAVTTSPKLIRAESLSQQIKRQNTNREIAEDIAHALRLREIVRSYGPDDGTGFALKMIKEAANK